MIKRIKKQLISCLLAASIFSTLSVPEIQGATTAVAIEKGVTQEYVDGTYEIPAYMYKENTDSLSHANGVLDGAKLTIKDGKGTLHVRFKPLFMMGENHYMSQMYKLTNITFSENGLPTTYDIEETSVVEEYDVVDRFNAPDSEFPATAGKMYPREIAMDVNLGEEATWVRISVPIMTSMGVGDSNARLMLDYTNIPKKEVSVPVVPDKKYKITYKLYGGTNNKANPTTFTKASSFTLKNPTRAGYTFLGWYTSSKFETKKTKIVKGTEKNYTLHARWQKVTVSKASIKTLKSTAKKKATVSWNAVSGAKGYEITYSRDKKFKSKKTVTTTSRTKTLTGLVSGKTYYVKVRAYKIDSTGKKVYGTSSTIKTVKVK